MAVTRSQFRALLALNRHKLKTRLARPAPPDSEARAYARAILKLTKRTQAAAELHVISILNGMADESVKADSHADAKSVAEGLKDLEREVNKIWNADKLTSMVEPVAGGVEEQQARAMNNQLRPVVGLDVVGSEPWIGKAANDFTTRNVSLIKTIPQRYLEEITKLVVSEAGGGERAGTLAKAIQQRGEVSESRAKLIARDQVTKFYGELNRARQGQLGIRKATWRTANDNRVREEHELLAGTTYDLNSPPEGGPGHAVNCRCWDEPDLESALTELENQPEPAPEPEEENDPTLPEPEPEATVEPMSPEEELAGAMQTLREGISDPALMKRILELEDQIRVAKNLARNEARDLFKTNPGALTEEQIKLLAPEDQKKAARLQANAEINKAANKELDALRAAAEARRKAKLEKNPEAAQETVDVKTYPLLGAVYIGETIKDALTHSYREGDATTLCRKIKAERLADSMTATDDPPTCRTCLGKDPRFKG